MLKTIFGVFIILHGLVHLLYFGQSRGYFELQPGLNWPDNAWIFSKFFDNVSIRNLAGSLLILCTLLLVAGGLGLLLTQDWWRTVVASGVTFSTVIYFLMWNGKLQRLDDQGGIGILINLAILALILVAKWPHFEA